MHSQREEVYKNKLVSNITYYAIFAKLRNVLSKILLLQIPEREHRKVFENVPIIGFTKGKSLKDILVRAKVPPLKTDEGFCGPCSKPRCKICKHITKRHQFESSSTKRIYSIRLQNLNCASKNVVYLFICKTCHKQYTGSTEEFWSGFNNYISSHGNLLRNKKVKQESFHAHFAEGLHQGESDWEVRLMDQGISVDDVRWRESYWQHKLDAFQPNGLNEREAALFLTQLYFTYPYSYCARISLQHLFQLNGTNTLLSYFSRIFFS